MAALRFILVEIPRVGGPAEVRDNRAIDLAVVQAVPVDVLEPCMRLDAAGAAADVAEAFGGVDGAEAGDEIARV